MKASIRIGVAGWSYPDWRGTFYPRGLEPRSYLPLVARHFDCAEINVSFYRCPDAAMAKRWLKAVEDRPDFLFTSKVPKPLTHERKLEPAALEAGAAELKAGLAPLAEAGRLGAVLLQFPFYFRDGPESRDRIRRLVEALRPLPAVVELRHRSFFFHPPPPEEGSGVRFLEEIGSGLANIDVPPGKGTVPPSSINTSPVGYVRLHGRNTGAWFDPKAGRDEKYNYLYSPHELREWAERIARLGARTQRTFVIANNHFRGQAPANALLLLHLLGRTPADAPRELLTTYPEVARALREPPPELEAAEARGAAAAPAGPARPPEGGAPGTSR